MCLCNVLKCVIKLRVILKNVILYITNLNINNFYKNKRIKNINIYFLIFLLMEM